ncbi:MAG: hypothetical protein GXX84_11460, partial [Acidobacteria bacterium]|nr:hypothetical protein [Acidobacteriota bacterium]
QLRSLNEEIARRDAIQNELEQKSKAAEEEAAALKTALQNAQYSSSQAVDALNAELARHQLIQKELEEKCRIAEDQLRSLESSLQESEAILIQRTEASTAELFQCHVALKELERRYQAADRQVTDLVNTVASHEAEIARREVYCRELESKRAELQISLEEARKNCDNLKAASDESAARLAGLETALREWEQKYRASEEERIAAEARLSHATEEHKVEIAQWDQRRQEWESRLKVAEDQHAATLRSVTAEAESRVSRMAQECRAAAEHLGSARHELEQIKSASFDLHMKYQRLSQFASAAVVLATVDGDVVQCNDAAAQLFKRIDANDDAKFRIYSFEGALRERLLRDRKLEGVEWSGLDGDGKVIRLQENSTLLEATMDGQPLVERILSDISAIYNLREELRRTQKKQSAGDLAYATVRSLKELCTSLVRSGEILMETRNGEDLRDLAEAILHDANRGIKHARQFLSISRKTDRLPSLLSLNEVLATNETLLRNLISEDIELQMNLAERIGLIFAERQEIVQLISNLVASSREALPLGGTIAIETSDIEIDSSAGVDGLQPGIFVSMTVSADGCTVHPERRTASISTIVERMGGYIEITQTPQCGNVYRFYWPRIESLTQTAASITVPAEICEVTPPQEP